MLAKKAPIPICSGRRVEKELELLYARKSAIDGLIESLQEYQQLRDQRLEEPNRKTA